MYNFETGVSMIIPVQSRVFFKRYASSNQIFPSPININMGGKIYVAIYITICCELLNRLSDNSRPFSLYAFIIQKNVM